MMYALHFTTLLCTLLQPSTSVPSLPYARDPVPAEDPIGDGQLEFLSGIWRARGWAKADPTTRIDLDAVLVLAPWSDGLISGFVERVYPAADLPGDLDTFTLETLAPHAPSATGYWAWDPDAEGWCSLSGWRADYLDQAQAFEGEGPSRTTAAAEGSDAFGDYRQTQAFDDISLDGWTFRIDRKYGDGTHAPLCRIEATRCDDRIEPVGTALVGGDDVQVTTLLEGFGGSRALAVDDRGTLYFGGDREFTGDVPLLARDPDGSLRVFAEGLAPAGLVWRDGFLWVHAHDVEGGRVVKIDREGRVEEVGALPGDPLAVDAEGNAYTVVQGEVLRLDPSGKTEVWSRSPLLKGGFGLTFDDAEGAPIVGTWLGGQVYRVRRDAPPEHLGSLPGSGRGRCAWMTMDGRDVIATSFGGSRVFRLRPNGEVHLVAGQGLIGNRDGAGRVARFHNPNGLAFSPNREILYVAEIRPGPQGPFAHGRLRRIAWSGK